MQAQIPGRARDSHHSVPVKRRAPSVKGLQRAQHQADAGNQHGAEAHRQNQRQPRLEFGQVLFGRESIEL